MFDVVVVGSANLDLVAGTARQPQPGETLLGHSFHEFAGGKGLNQAVAAVRCGATVAFVAAVGDDEAGRRLIDVANGDGIDTSAIAVVAEAPTGRAMILVSDDGENSIVVIPGANARVTGADIPAAKVVVAQLEVPLHSVRAAFGEAKRRGAVTVLNPAPAQSLPEALLAVCDIIVPNEHELELLGGVRALHAAGVDTVIVTRGAAGVTYHQQSAEPINFPAIPVQVVDTTGAGDAFCGNFAARLAAGDRIREAIGWAAAAGALTVTVAGAVPSLPHSAAVADLLNVQG